jgi:hypothetical protein
MHEVAIVIRRGIIDLVVDYRVCTCKIGEDHQKVNGKNVKP